MATKTNSLKILILFSLSILLSFPVTATAIPTADLDAVLLLLRANGHALFANAISTSDLLFDLLSLPSLTLFAPTDPALFALDMTQTPPFYLSTLRLHALPLRLSWPQLLQLPNGSSFPTLLPSRVLRVTRRRFGDVFVGGAQLVMPGLYYATHVAVHGLAGILTFRSPLDHQNDTVFIPTVNHTAVVPPVPKIPRIPTIHKNRTHSSPINRTVSPVPKIPRNCTNCSDSSPINHSILSPPVDRTTFFLPVNHTIVSPAPKIPRIPTNGTNRTDSSPQVNHTIVSPSPGARNGQTNRTDSSPINRTTVVWPPVLASAPGPAGISGYSPAESPEDRNVLMGSSSGLTLSTEIRPAPAPLGTKLIRSRELGEVFLSGEVCTTAAS